MKLFLLLFLLVQLQKPARPLSSDGLTLLALKSAVAPVESAADNPFSDWNENDPTPCHWSGISCADVPGFSEPRVVGITITGKNIRGYIPSELGSLGYLRRLNLHGNRFSGSIPEQLLNATSLRSIFLYENNLSGSLPPAICNLPRLQNLDLSSNNLSGGIPSSFGQCRQLQRLVLARNYLSGEIPAGIWPNMEYLAVLDLSCNQLSGSLPPDISELRSLSGTLNLSFNRLSGELPESLEKLPATVSFDLRGNNFTGEIPQTGIFTKQSPAAFLKNPGLCGSPLAKPCGDSSWAPSPSPAAGNTAPQSGSLSSSRKGFKPGLIVLVSAADAVGVALIGLIIAYVYRKRRECNSCSCTGLGKLGGGDSGDSSEPESDKEGENAGEGDLVAIDRGFTFELDELLRASAYVLGKNGQGIVYKVVLGNGTPVAVRRLGDGGGQRYKEFAAEIRAIGRIKHPNIVQLRAYYWAEGEKLLISDYISNGSLRSALRGKQSSPSLTWSTRLRIAKETARGLAHLHDCGPRKFVHGDIKPSNILLDAHLKPYISDLGLDRLVSITGNSSSDSVHSAVPDRRCQNYLAPEARLPGSRPTQRLDVFSFGLVLLEMLTGKAPEASTGEGAAELVKWVRKGLEEAKPVAEMVDPVLLSETLAKKEVVAVFRVAVACTETEPELRPRMKTVADNLESMGR